MTGPVLVVVAHMDDECFMGATIARFCAEGHRVTALALADSETSRRGATSEDIRRRVKSFYAAADVLGHKPRLFGWPVDVWPDQRLDTVPLLDLTRCIELAIDDLKPVTVFTHSPHDLNADHRRTYDAVLPAVRPKSGVQNVYCFEGPAMCEPFAPVAFWAVTVEQVEQQHRALACYADELAAEWMLIRARAEAYGYSVGVPLAQGFEVIRCLH